MMGRLMHQLRAPTLDEQYAILKAARERITQSGPARLKHTIPAIAFGALAIVKGLCEAKEPSQTSPEPVSCLSWT